MNEMNPRNIGTHPRDMYAPEAPEPHVVRMSGGQRSIDPLTIQTGGSLGDY